MNIDLKLETYEQLKDEIVTLHTNNYLNDLKINKLQSNWNSLREWLEETMSKENVYPFMVLNKMNELEEGDNK